MDQTEKTSIPRDKEYVERKSTATTLGESSEANLVIDPKDERKLLWKLDVHIAPIVMILYLIAFLDRLECSFKLN